MTCIHLKAATIVTTTHTTGQRPLAEVLDPTGHSIVVVPSFRRLSTSEELCSTERGLCPLVRVDWKENLLLSSGHCRIAKDFNRRATLLDVNPKHGL